MKDIIDEILMGREGDEFVESVTNDLNNGVDLYEASRKYCEQLKDTKTDKNRFLAEVYEILLEADVQFLNAQIFVVSQLLDHPKVEHWGLEHFPEWDKMNNSDKVSALLKYFGSDATGGALAQARATMNTSPDITMKNPFVFDVADVSEPYTGVKSVHWEQFKKSKIFDRLSKIFLDALD